MTYVFDRSEKKVIAGPIVINGDAPVSKYQAESDGRTFWAYNGSEVFYDDERLYDALDYIVKLEAEVERLTIKLKKAIGDISNFRGEQ